MATAKKTTKKVIKTVKKLVNCPDCKIPGIDINDYSKLCPTCKGTGKI